MGPIKSTCKVVKWQTCPVSAFQMQQFLLGPYFRSCHETHTHV